MTESTNLSADEMQLSCNPQLTRAQFLEKVTSRAIKAGTIATGVIIADAFIAPPKIAAASGGSLIGNAGPGAAIAATDISTAGPGAAFAEV